MPEIYSQSMEQEYILKACEGAERKRLLDIGAFDPTDKSNSRALIEAGWDAVLVEPSPKPVRSLVEGYGGEIGALILDEGQNVTVLCAAVAVEPGIVKLAITDDLVSTSSKANEDRWKERGGFFGYMEIQAITIPDLLTRYGAFDFVNIDAEGQSVDLLRVLLATEMFPRCVCVEFDDRIGEALSIAQDRGYRLAYKSNENLVLVHE